MKWLRVLIEILIITLCVLQATAGADAVAGNTGVDSYDLELRVKRKSPPAEEMLPEQPPAKAAIRVNPGRVVAELNPLFIGYNIEDLNHAFFPGLCAQMIYGESFEDEPDVELPDGWEAWLEPINRETPTDPALVRKWRGAWAFENGEVTLTGARQRRICSSKATMTNGVVECDVFQPAHERNFWGPGLLVCWKPQSFYYVYIAPERDMLVLAKGSDERFTQSAKVLAERRLPLDYDRWYRLKTTVKDGRVTVCLDGKEEISFQDTAPLTGGVGLESSFCVGRFRNLLVIPEGAAPWSADFSCNNRPYTHRANISRWWDALVTGSAEARFKWDAEDPYNTDRSQCLEKLGGDGAVGIYNTGLHNWGLSFRKDRTYQGRLYLRGDSGTEVTLALQSRDGASTYGTQTLRGIERDWRRFDIQIQSNSTDTGGRFALWLEGPGRVWVDQVVLMPSEEELYKGLPVRRDLADKMVAGIRHIRFGGDMINTWAFDWKQMLLPQDKRRQYLDGWNYHKSAQFMIFEFLDFCRAAGVEPIINFGEHLSPQDVTEFIEYCNGDASSQWGGKRVANGRPAPYDIRYLMYGNGLPPVGDLTRLANWVQANYPAVKVICGDVGHETWTNLGQRDPAAARAMNKLADRVEVLGSRPEVGELGSHLNWVENIALTRTAFPSFVERDRPFFYAEEVNSGIHNWQRGLCDAMFIITGEQNGKTVWANSFCTALQASGHLYEWDEGHIHFTSAESWYQPSGWAVRLLGESFQPVVLGCDVECPSLMLQHRTEKGTCETSSPAVVASATRDRDGHTLILKVVNLWGGAIDAALDLGATRVDSLEAATLGCRHLKAVNTAAEPDYVVPHFKMIANPASRMNVAFGAGTFTVLKFRRDSANPDHK